MPAPAKMPEETRKKYASRLVRFYVHEGFPQRQAVAIALRKAGVPKRKKKTRRGRKSR